MRTTMPKPPVATQTLPAPVASPIAGAPMPIVFTTRRLTGSMRVTVPSWASPTQIAPSPDATDAGFDPAGIEATTRFVLASIATTAGAVTTTAAGGSSRARSDHEYQRRQRDREEHAADGDAPPPAAEPGARRMLLVRPDCSRRSRRRCLERGILSEDRALEPLELRSRLEPELAREQPAAVAVGLSASACRPLR